MENVTSSHQERRYALFLGQGVIFLALMMCAFLPFSVPSQSKIIANYWVIMPYMWLSLPILGLSILANFILFALMVRQGRLVHLKALGLTLLALVLAFISVFPQGLVSYYHISSLQINQTRYQLGITYAMDGDYTYLISQCDSWRFWCEGYGYAPVIPVGLDATLPKPLGFEYDNKTDTFSVQTTHGVLPVKRYQ